jgi:hypothetical protein
MAKALGVNPILVAGLLYGYDAALGLLLLGASYMAYHVSKIVGHFRAWIYLMTAILLTALDQFLSLGSLVFMSPAQIELALSKDNPIALALAVGLGLSISSLFFVGMFEIRRIFRKRMVAEEELEQGLVSEVAVASTDP